MDRKEARLGGGSGRQEMLEESSTAIEIGKFILLNSQHGIMRKAPLRTETSRRYAMKPSIKIMPGAADNREKWAVEQGPITAGKASPAESILRADSEKHGGMASQILSRFSVELHLISMIPEVPRNLIHFDHHCYGPSLSRVAFAKPHIVGLLNARPFKGDAAFKKR